jgi:hypothetical protein
MSYFQRLGGGDDPSVELCLDGLLCSGLGGDYDSDDDCASVDTSAYVLKEILPGLSLDGGTSVPPVPGLGRQYNAFAVYVSINSRSGGPASLVRRVYHDLCERRNAMSVMHAVPRPEDVSSFSYVNVWDYIREYYMKQLNFVAEVRVTYVAVFDPVPMWMGCYQDAPSLLRACAEPSPHGGVHHTAHGLIPPDGRSNAVFVYASRLGFSSQGFTNGAAFVVSETPAVVAPEEVRGTGLVWCGRLFY